MYKNLTKAIQFFLNKGLEIKTINETNVLLQNEKVSFAICPEDGYMSYAKLEDIKRNKNSWEIYHETNVNIFEENDIEDIEKFIGGV